MKLLLAFLLLMSTAHGAVVTCGQSTDSFASCTYAAASGVNDGDTLLITKSFVHGNNNILLAHNITITAVSRDIQWVHNGNGNAVTVGASSSAGHYYFNGFTMVNNSTGGVFGCANTDMATRSFHFDNMFMGLTRTISTATIPFNFGGAATTNLTICAKNSTFVRQGYQGSAIFSISTGTSCDMHLDNCILYSNVTGTGAAALRFAVFNVPGVCKLHNVTWICPAQLAAGSTGSCGINLNASNTPMTAIELINVAMFVNVNNSPDSIFLGVSNTPNAIIKNIATTIPLTSIGVPQKQNDFVVSWSDLATDFTTGVSFETRMAKPISGLSQLTYKGFNLSSIFTRDIIGAPWNSLTWGVGAYMVPTNVQQASPNNIVRYPTQFLVPVQ